MSRSEFLVPLDISAEQFERLYRGTASDVLARDVHGVRIRFPAARLRAFVTRDGVQGLFVITVDANNKLIDIRRKTP